SLFAGHSGLRERAEKRQQEPDYLVDERRSAHHRLVGYEAGPTNRRRIQAEADQREWHPNLRAYAQNRRSNEAPLDHPLTLDHRRRSPARPGADAHRSLPEPHRELSVDGLAGEQPTHR